MKALLVAALIGLPTAADGFEQPPVAHSFQRYTTGAQLGSWTVTRGDVDLTTSDLWTPAEGRQTLDLDGARPGAVARTFRSTPLLTYRISYALAGNYVGGPAVKTGEVRVNGKVVQQMSFDTTGKSRNNMGYRRHQTHILAKSTTLRLEFASTNAPGGFGPVLDDIKVDSCLVVLCPRSAATPA